MKIAQALNLRKSLNDQRENALRSATANAYLIDGQTSDSNPDVEVALFLSITAKLQALIGQINHTNSVTIIVHDGTSYNLTQARVVRDVLTEVADKLKELPTQKTKSYGAGEPLHLILNSAEITHRINDYSLRAMELDDIIQQTNWSVDLVE